MNDASSSPSTERQMLERVLLATIEEQRRARRWKIFFRFAWLAVIVFAVLTWLIFAVSLIPKASHRLRISSILYVPHSSIRGRRGL